MRRAPRRGGLAAGETEGALAPEPRSQPDPERSEGTRPKRNQKNAHLRLSRNLFSDIYAVNFVKEIKAGAHHSGPRSLKLDFLAGTGKRP